MLRRIRSRLGPGWVPVAFALAGCGGAGTPIDREIADSPAGVVTVVEFVDYECLFCRELHPRLWELLEQNRGAVRVVLKMVPLDEHPDARKAAAAELCAAEQGKALEMHDALMRAPVMTDETFEAAARAVGAEVTELQDCMRSGRVEAQIDADVAAWQAMGADGLPMVFIGHEKLVGMNPIELYEQALRDATE